MSIDYSTFAYPKSISAKKAKHPIKKISRKQAKKERNRYSILTDNLDRCFICGAAKCDFHEVFGGMNRSKSMEHGLVIPICRGEHSNIRNYEDWLHRIGQKKFEETHTREEFIKEFGKNFI